LKNGYFGGSIISQFKTILHEAKDNIEKADNLPYQKLPMQWWGEATSTILVKVEVAKEPKN